MTDEFQNDIRIRNLLTSLRRTEDEEEEDEEG